MKIFITRGEEKSGPFTLDQVREHLDKGDLMSDDLACQEGMDEWIPLSELMDSLMSTNPATPEKSKKRKVLIGIGAFLGVVVVLVIPAIVAGMIREAKRMERVVWHLRIKGSQIGISSPSAPPLIGADGTIFVSGDNLYALDARQGMLFGNSVKALVEQLLPSVRMARFFSEARAIGWMKTLR